MVRMYDPPLRSQVEKNEALNQINQVDDDDDDLEQPQKNDQKSIEFI